MSNERDDGGCAFPHGGAVTHRDGTIERVEFRGGMTLRDYFAAKALVGNLQNVEVFSKELARQGKSHIGLAEFMASMAYGYADAMLKARQS